MLFQPFRHAVGRSPKIACRAQRNELENTLSAFSHSLGQRQQFAVLCKGARHMRAAARLMLQDAGRGKAYGARRHRLSHQTLHLGQIGRGRCLMPGRAFAHHIKPQGRVREVRRHVHGEVTRIELVEIIRKTLPRAVQPLVKHDAGISSTPSMMSMSALRSCCRAGAKPTPQLPAMAVVTPLEKLGSSCWSQRNWPS